MSTQPITLARGALPRLLASRWVPLPVVLAGTFMVVLDFFIVNVALPSIQSGLHASSSAIEWVLAGYGLTSAVFLITAGRLGDRIGRRRALSVYGMVMGLAAVGGQLIGGALVQANVAGLGWRSCFLINVPVGALALVLAPRLVPESRAPESRGTDLVGTVLITAGLTAIVLPLVEGRQHGWPAWTWISLGLAPVILLAFAAHQRRLSRGGGAPMLDPSLFAERTFTAGLLAQLVFWSGQASFFLVLALYLQQGRGLSALNAGLVLTILAVAYLLASLRAPALATTHGRRVLAVGALVLAAGHALLLVTVADVGVGGSIALLAPGLILVGAGMGLGITPLATIILASVEPYQAGAASGALTTMQNVGNAIGVAVIGVIFFGALHSGFADAFQLSLAALATILVSVAVLTRLLPGPARS